MSKEIKETLVISKEGTEFTFFHTGIMPEKVIEEVKKMTDKEIIMTLKSANFEQSRMH